MKVLTAKQHEFAKAITRCKTVSAAYRLSYKSNSQSPKTIWEASSRLSKHPKVIARLDELRAEKEAEERMLRLSYGDFVINELQELALSAKSDKARIKALELLGKTSALFSGKI